MNRVKVGTQFTEQNDRLTLKFAAFERNQDLANISKKCKIPDSMQKTDFSSSNILTQTFAMTNSVGGATAQKS